MQGFFFTCDLLNSKELHVDEYISFERSYFLSNWWIIIRQAGFEVIIEKEYSRGHYSKDPGRHDKIVFILRKEIHILVFIIY